MEKGTILVTGATGLVGSHCARRAAEAGYDVQVMVRGGSARACLDGVPVTFVEGDLAQPETLPAALAGADYVVHSAAHVGDWGPAEKYRAINVVALAHMLNAVQRHGRLRRWIQISSLGVYPACDHYGTDESTPPNLEGLDGYTRTKAEAEVLVNEEVRERNFPAAILRPGFIYGPGDRHALPRVVAKIKSGKMKVIGRGDKLLNNTCVGNLVDAIMLVLENPAAVGETFNIRDGRLVTREEYISTVCEYLGKPYPRRVPVGVAKLLVRPIEGLARLRGATEAPLLTAAVIKFMTLNLDFSIAKAERVLGYQPRVDFQDGIRETLDWLEAKAKSAGDVAVAV